MSIPMEAIWGIAILVFLIVEGATFGITSIWFSLGSLAALISSIFGAPIWLQIMWFIVVSGVTVWIARPFVKKHVNAKHQPTNADRVIGKLGVVTEEINNLAGTGAVHISGKVWTARAVEDGIIREGITVQAVSIEGVKLMVTLPQTEEDIIQ